MKKFQLFLTLLVVPVTALILNGCILDAFDEITQNMSIERNFTLSGNSNTVVPLSATFRLSDSQLYMDHRNKIKKMRYKAASFNVSENNVAALQGNIILTLKTATGLPLFTKTLTAFKPAEYLNIKARVLDLTQTEIDAINAYLGNADLLDTISFTAGLTMQNVTPANTNVTMKSFVSLALEMTIEP